MGTALLAGLAAGVGFGQTPGPLEEIVVTGTAQPKPLSEIGASVTVIDRERIEKSQARDLFELLRGISGLSVVRTGSRGGTTSIFARGGTDHHNLVLLDGVQLNQGGGGFDFSSLSTDGVERIEIVRGPMSALYGSGAMASVIQVITRRGEGRTGGGVRALYGSDYTYELAAALAGGSDALGYSLNAGRYATQGLNSLNNRADNSSLRGRLDLRPSDALDVKLTTSYTDSAFHFPTDFVPDVPGGFPPVDPDQGNRKHEESAGLDVGFGLSPQLEQRLALRWNAVKTYNFDGFNPPPPGISQFDFGDSQGSNREGRLSGQYRLLWNGALGESLQASATLGLEYERETYGESSRTVNVDFSSGVEVRLPPGPRLSSREARSNRAGFLQTDLAFSERISLTLGARLDDNGEFGSVLDPLVALSWNLPRSGTRLRAAASRGFKEPLFSERFGLPAFTIVPNPGLAPERSRSLEGGVTQTLFGDAAQLSLTYFRTDFEDLIAFVSRQLGDPGAPGGVRFESDFENIRGTRSQGLETELSGALPGHVRVGATYTLLRTRVLDAGGVQSIGFSEGQALLRQPRHSGSLWVTYGGDRLDLRLGATFVGERLDRDDGASPVALIRNGSYARVDLALAYGLFGGGRERGTRLLVRLENLLDADYQEAFGFESPGFQWFAGIEQKF